MEIFDKLFGTKRRDQEKLLKKVDIENGPTIEIGWISGREELIADISNNEFMRLITEKEIEEYECHTRTMSDTHNLVGLYIDLGKDVKVRTEVGGIFYSKGRTILNDLYDLSFRSVPEKETSLWWGSWQIYRRTKK